MAKMELKAGSRWINVRVIHAFTHHVILHLSAVSKVNSQPDGHVHHVVPKVYMGGHQNKFKIEARMSFRP